MDLPIFGIPTIPTDNLLVGLQIALRLATVEEDERLDCFWGLAARHTDVDTVA